MSVAIDLSVSLMPCSIERFLLSRSGAPAILLGGPLPGPACEPQEIIREVRASSAPEPASSAPGPGRNELQSGAAVRACTSCVSASASNQRTRMRDFIDPSPLSLSLSLRA
eukprot:5588399-Pyramimonas_sp.AAC.1